MALTFSSPVSLVGGTSWVLAQGSRVWETRPSRALSNSFPPSNLRGLPDSGREFFVGLSKWTNHRGAEIVADTFRVRSGTRLGRERGAGGGSERPGSPLGKMRGTEQPMFEDIPSPLPRP